MIWGAYIHLPWCRYRCPYCAFVVDARKDPPHEAYEAALLREWALRRPLFQRSPVSLYFGGGTPSRSPARTFQAIIQALSPSPSAEITAEANPEDCTPALLDSWRSLGINRISLGVQSFAEPVAARLGRRTGSRAAERSVRMAQAAGFPSISIDLIFGGPHQSLEDWETDLRKTLDLGVEHCSIYGLTQEEGTPFGRTELPVADEDLWREMYDRAVQILEEGGIHRYEVSNFAREGHRSVHNQLYWRPEPWMGLGAGAHAWLPDRRRASNTRDLQRYLTAEDPTETMDPPDHPMVEWDLLWSMLRHVEGVDREHYQRLTGRWLQPPPALLKEGLLIQTPTHLRLGPGGFPIADGIAQAFHRYNQTLHSTPSQGPR